MSGGRGGSAPRSFLPAVAAGGRSSMSQGSRGRSHPLFRRDPQRSQSFLTADEFVHESVEGPRALDHRDVARAVEDHLLRFGAYQQFLVAVG